jgi:hypothetical protein
MVSQQIEDILSTIITSARRIGGGNEHDGDEDDETRRSSSSSSNTSTTSDSFSEFFREARSRQGYQHQSTPARLNAINSAVQRFQNLHQRSTQLLIQEVENSSSPPIPTTIIETSPAAENDPDEEEFKL